MTSTTLSEEFDIRRKGITSTIPTVSESISKSTCLESAKGLKNRVVVITGAGSGFGLAYATKAAEFGAKVVLSDLKYNAVLAVEKEIKANGGEAASFPRSCNTTIWEDQVAMFNFARKTYGHIDIVIPNAGIGELPGLLEDALDADGELKKPNMTTLEVNITGVSYTLKLAFYHLRQNPTKLKKSIVFIGSMASHLGLPGGPVYSMAKHAILGLFRSTYYNATVDGINSCIICPWFSATAILPAGTRLALTGLPLTSVEDVVLAMLKASGDQEFTGYTLAVDATGILALPFAATECGTEGYYASFASRAYGPIKIRRIIYDLYLIHKQFGGAKSLMVVSVSFVLSFSLLSSIMSKIVGSIV